jgi:hypothetical protein
VTDPGKVRRGDLASAAALADHVDRGTNRQFARRVWHGAERDEPGTGDVTGLILVGLAHVKDVSAVGVSGDERTDVDFRNH